VPLPLLSLELLQLHWDELEYLWGRRQSVLRSPVDTPGRLADLDERIEAHVQGLLVGGDAVTPLVESGLCADEPLPALAAALTLLRSTKEAPVLEVFRQAEAGRLDGIRQALCHAPVAPAAPLRSLLASPSAAVAVAAAEVLAFHQAPECKHWTADRLLNHEDPAIRRAAWRVVSLGAPCSPDSYRAGLRDEDVSVRREALEAAAWGGHRDLIGHCQEATDGEALLLLAILGKAEQVSRILDVGRAAGLGALWFRILGAFGHPAVVEVLLNGIESKDSRTALGAGAAFTKITGVDIASDRRVLLPPEDGHEPDEFEKEFLDEVFLPSPELARAHWQKVEPQFRKGTRWCRGLDLSEGGSRELWNRLDLESRWEAHLRARFERRWPGSPADLERFPQQ
jgi:uncharacterized protein (TIGR02270 family)